MVWFVCPRINQPINCKNAKGGIVTILSQLWKSGPLNEEYRLEKLATMHQNFAFSFSAPETPTAVFSPNTSFARWPEIGSRSTVEAKRRRAKSIRLCSKFSVKTSISTPRAPSANRGMNLRTFPLISSSRSLTMPASDPRIARRAGHRPLEHRGSDGVSKVPAKRNTSVFYRPRFK